MSEQVQYITDEKGQQIGVVLNLQQYQQLRTQSVASADTELLLGVSDDELRALADSMLAPSAQKRLEQLLESNASSQISEEGSAELDRLLADIDYLTILKTRARYTLNQQDRVIAAV